jgi:hypothetical protein
MGQVVCDAMPCPVTKMGNVQCIGGDLEDGPSYVRASPGPLMVVILYVMLLCV